MAVAGGFSSARYVRNVVKKRMGQALHPERFKIDDKEKEAVAAVKKDLADRDTVIGKAYKAAKKAATNEAETAIEAEDAILKVASKKIPFHNRVTTSKLHLRASEKTTAAIIFASVGSIAGYAVYKVASSLRGEKDNQDIAR